MKIKRYINKAIRILRKNREINKDIKIVEQKRNKEIRKFKDPRRVGIFSSVVLSEKQKKEIDELYVSTYGEKIPHTWHRHFTAFTGNFDKYYFPELLYIPEFEYYMNYAYSYVNVFEDKNILPLIASAVGIYMPKSYISITNGIYRNEKNCIVTRKEVIDSLRNIGKVFFKPTVGSSSGLGCRFLSIADGIDELSGETVESILNETVKNAVIQELITCQKDIAAIYSKSVNTFRIITYIWKNEINIVPSIMRIGVGGAVVDNAHAGGIFIAVNCDGTLHKTAFSEFKEEYTKHPDTGVVFEDYKISNFDKVLASAKKLHEAIPQIGVINWDFTISEDGTPVLIEANICGGGIWVIQMAHGKGPFGEKTPEILAWLKIMKNTAPSDRKKYIYGLNINERG